MLSKFDIKTTQIATVENNKQKKTLYRIDLIALVLRTHKAQVEN